MTNNYIRPGGFSILPVVVKNLLIINGLMFLASVSLPKILGVELDDILGLHFLGSDKFEPYQLITYMFMHGSFMHLFFNMFALWMFGYAIENYFGPKKFLIYYFVTGIGAALIHNLVVLWEIQPVLNHIDSFLSNPSIPGFKDFFESTDLQIYSNDFALYVRNFTESYNELLKTNQAKALQNAVQFMYDYRTGYLNAPVIVGASGSVFGILLAFGMLFPNTLIYLYFAIPVKAKWMVIGYGALELWSGLAATPGDNIAHFAHLGGMIFGFILIKLWKKKQNNRWIS